MYHSNVDLPLEVRRLLPSEPLQDVYRIAYNEGVASGSPDPEGKAWKTVLMGWGVGEAGEWIPVFAEASPAEKRDHLLKVSALHRRASRFVETGIGLEIIQEKRYDPNQPRVPKGSPDGGKWTDGDVGRWKPETFDDGIEEYGSGLAEAEHFDTRPGVRDYAGSNEGSFINADLRESGELNLGPSGLAVVKELTASIHAEELDRDLLAYRGTAWRAVAPLRVGDVFIDKGFTSTSLSKAVADYHASPGGTDPAWITAEVLIPRGAKALVVRGSNEREVIIQRGSRYRVEAVDDHGYPTRIRLVQQEGLVRGADGKLSWDFITLKAFDPNQPRHPKGHPAGGQWRDEMEAVMDEDAENERIYRPAVRRVCEKLGFNPDDVTISNIDPATFQVNGAQYFMGGQAHLDTGKIFMYPRYMSTDYFEELLAHEIAHVKYESYLAAVAADTAHMRLDPGPAPDPSGQYFWQRRGGTDGMMKPDGLLREPYDRKYPLYHRHTLLTMDWEGLKRDDGVSSYSRDWWGAATSGKATIKQAYHETIAEMARAHYKSGQLPGSKSWKAIYREVDKHWSKRK